MAPVSEGAGPSGDQRAGASPQAGPIQAQGWHDPGTPLQGGPSQGGPHGVALQGSPLGDGPGTPLQWGPTAGCPIGEGSTLQRGVPLSPGGPLGCSPGLQPRGQPSRVAIPRHGSEPSF